MRAPAGCVVDRPYTNTQVPGDSSQSVFWTARGAPLVHVPGAIVRKTSVGLDVNRRAHRYRVVALSLHSGYSSTLVAPPAGACSYHPPGYGSQYQTAARDERCQRYAARFLGKPLYGPGNVEGQGAPWHFHA